jgi:2-dehydropantoate 2-reductase
MKILVLGAGATGGFFGGRLANAGADVTFLVRPKRQALLAANGLRIESARGNIVLPVATVTKANASDGYDVVVVSCKAYDLDSAIDAIRPAVGERTYILPLLNGLKHLDILDAAFGRDRVLGGTCHIGVTLADDGTIRHLNAFDILTHGFRTEGQRTFCEALQREFQRGGFEVRLSEDIVGAMWEKWVLLATLAGMTCLMRGSIGEIVATDAGKQRISDMLGECIAVATASGQSPSDQAIEQVRDTLTQEGSTLTSSMLRDMLSGGRVEADHILGDLVSRAEALAVATPLLRLAYIHLQVYQNHLAAGA